jgi:hypothetical protein
LTDIRFRPVRAQLRPPRPIERRNAASRHALRRRVHAEFFEMPGLTLTVEQAARLFGLPADVCRRVFGELVQVEMLRLTADGRYALAPASVGAK